MPYINTYHIHAIAPHRPRSASSSPCRAGGSPSIHRCSLYCFLNRFFGSGFYVFHVFHVLHRDNADYEARNRFGSNGRCFRHIEYTARPIFASRIACARTFDRFFVCRSIQPFAAGKLRSIRLAASPKAWMQRQEKKRSKVRAHAILEAKIGRAVYSMWRKQRPFDAKRFLAS